VKRTAVSTRTLASLFALLLMLLVAGCGAITTPSSSEGTPAAGEGATKTDPGASTTEGEQAAAEPTKATETEGSETTTGGTAPTPLVMTNEGNTAPAGEAGAKPAVSEGRIALMGPYGQDLQVFVLNADGTGLTKVTEHANGSAFPTLSPDGKRVAYVASIDGNPEIYLQEVGNSQMQRLTNNPGLDNQPVFSPDGSKIAFISDRDGDLDVWVMNADGSDAKLIVGRKGDDILGGWSPDSKSLVFVKQTQAAQNIWKVDAEGGEPVELTEAKGIDAAPSFSPDGQRIAFYSNREGGKLNIFTMAPDGSDVQQLTSNGQDNLLPIYSPDGKWIAYGTAQGQAISLNVISAKGGMPVVLNENVQGLPTSWTVASEPLPETGFTQGPSNSGVEVNASVLEGAPTKGKADAPITMIEFSDFQCPFCKRYYDQTESQIEKYIEEGQIRLIWVDLPLVSIHPQAPAAHRAAYCAREQTGDEGFWAMHDALFTSQEQWSGQPQPERIFQDLATKAGLDGEKLAGCLAENKYSDVIDRGVAEATRLQITGTPTFFINGSRLVGAQPFDEFQKLISQYMTQ
jgi:protein-disulfide isomerase